MPHSVVRVQRPAKCSTAGEVATCTPDGLKTVIQCPSVLEYAAAGSFEPSRGKPKFSRIQYYVGNGDIVFGSDAFAVLSMDCVYTLDSGALSEALNSAMTCKTIGQIAECTR